jgi:hypothetical protein
MPSVKKYTPNYLQGSKLVAQKIIIPSGTYGKKMRCNVVPGTHLHVVWLYPTATQVTLVWWVVVVVDWLSRTVQYKLSMYTRVNMYVVQYRVPCTVHKKCVIQSNRLWTAGSSTPNLSYPVLVVKYVPCTVCCTKNKTNAVYHLLQVPTRTLLVHTHTRVSLSLFPDRSLQWYPGMVPGTTYYDDTLMNQPTN